MNYFYKYLPLNDEVRQSRLYVIAGGYTFVPANVPYPPVPHPDDHELLWNLGRTLREHQIIYIARGSGCFESESGGRHRIVAGTLFALFPDEWHRYRPATDTGWDEYWIAFSGSKARSMISTAGLSPKSPLLYTAVSVSLKEEFIRLSDEMRREEIGYERILADRTSLILSMSFAKNLRHGYAESNLLPIIEEAKRILTESTDKSINMAELAGVLNIGYSLFRKVFREYTGFAPAQYHLEQRLNTAMNLLTSSSLSMSEIGVRIGIESPAYFSRLFKRKTGCTPYEFRALSQGKREPVASEVANKLPV